MPVLPEASVAHGRAVPADGRAVPRWTVAIAEDHVVFRRELVVALERDPAIDVVVEGADLARVVSRLSAPPDVVLADVSSPGRDLVEVLARFATGSRPPVVAMLGPEDEPGPALLAGATGAVSKRDLLRSGPELVRRAAAGVPLVGAEAGRDLLRLARAGDLALTPRQEEVLRQLAAGRDALELADWLGGPADDARQLVRSTIMELRDAARRDRRSPVAPTAGGQPSPFPPVDSDPE